MTWTPRRIGILLATAMIGLAIGLVVRTALMAHGATPVAQHAQTPANSATPVSAPTTSPASDLYSLAVPAQRARDYPGSKVTLEQAPVEGVDYRVSLVSYRSDGLKIYTQAVLPATPRPKHGYPVIILAHGYINPADYTTDEPFYTAFAVGLAKRGYLVLKPDFRGHGQSWGVPEGAYFSSGYVADILNLAASLPTYPEADSQKVALMGHSMGGHAALMAAIVRPAAFKAVVLAAPSAGQLTDMYDNWTAYSDFADPVTLGIRRRVVKLFGAPDSGSQFWREVDPYTYLTDIKAPVQIDHSTNDDTVPYRFSTELAEAMKAAKRPVSLETFEAGHSFDGPARDALLDKATAFIAKSLAQ